MFIGRKLKLLFKTTDVFDKLFAAMLAGDALSKIINAYSQYKFNQLQLQPIVITSKGSKLTGVSSGLIASTGPYPDLTVDAPSTTEIFALSLTPSSPANGPDYVAKGTVFCALAGDVVTISVMGTDGYTDSVAQTASANETQGFELVVPGAESGVRDVVTLHITRGGATVASRTAELIFG